MRRLIRKDDGRREVSMKAMTTAWIRNPRAVRRNHPLFDLLLRIAAALAWNAF